MANCFCISASCCCLTPCLVDCVAGNILDGKDSIKPENKKILGQLGSATKTIITALPEELMGRNKNPPTDDRVRTKDVDLGWKKTGNGFNDWKQSRTKKILHNVSPNLSVDILEEDDLFTKYTFIEKFTGRALRNKLLFPLEDSTIYVSSEEAASIAEDLQLVEGQAQPVTYTTDFNMLTDESFSRIFFYGMGAVLLEKQDKASDGEYGPFMVDIPIQKLKTRKYYRSYGACIHFSEAQMVTAIYDYGKSKTFKPGDDGWEQAKMLAKVTAFTLITAREHLVWTHLLVSNSATKESAVELPPSHPIRRLMTVFTFHATEVNLEAFSTLVPNTSVLYRASGFTYDSMKLVFDGAYTSCNAYEPFPDREINSALRGLSEEGKFPYWSEGVAYFEIVRSFVREWLEQAGAAATDQYAKAFYSAIRKTTLGMKYVLPVMGGVDDMVNLLSQIIFQVTAYHELVGHVVDYTISPSRSGFRLASVDESKIDLQSFLLTSLISGSTSVRMPDLMSDFANFFGIGGAPSWERNLWDNFVAKLGDQSDVVKAADAERDVEFKYFDPARFECSVSV